MQKKSLATMSNDNPSRVELPKEAFHRRPIKQASTPEVSDVPDMPVERIKPKLGIRRNASADQKNASVSSAVAAVEERYNAAARKARAERLKKGISNFISIVLLLALLGGGYVVYDHWKKGDIADVANKLIDSVSHGSESERQGAPETRNDIHEIKTDGRPVQKPEEPTPQETETQDRAIKAGSTAESYVQIANRLHGARLKLWKNLDKSHRPGKIDAKFIAIIPESKSNVLCYEIISTTNGIASISYVKNDDARDDVAINDFEAKLESKGGIVWFNGAMYAFRAKTANKEWAAPRAGETFDPANLYFGALYNVIEKFGFDASRLKYEIAFIPSEGESALHIADLQHGRTLPYDTFEKVAAPIAKKIQLKAVPGYKPQKYKKTVVFYDGAFVGKGHGGETLVPRKWANPRSDRINDHRYSEWLSLRDEAYRQEREAQRVADENARKAAERMAKLDAYPDSQTIRKVLQDGKIIIRANYKETR